jgi:hypothetical protein
VQRVYLYHWDTGLDGDGVAATWDSGFVSPDGRARPALQALEGVLTRSGGTRR